MKAERPTPPESVAENIIDETQEEIETLEDVNDFDGLYKLLDKKQPNEKAREKIRSTIEKARGMVDAFVDKKDELPRFQKLLEDPKSPLALLKKELQQKIVEILEREATQDQEIVGSNVEMLGKDMIKLLNNESMGARGTVEIDGEDYFLMGANGLADAKIGKIKAFGNSDKEMESAGVDKEIIDNSDGFRIRVAAYKYYKIIDLENEGDFSERGLKNMKRAFKKYNSAREDT